MKKLFTLLMTITLITGSYSFFSKTQIDAENSTKKIKKISVIYGDGGKGTTLLEIPSVEENEKASSDMTLIEKKDQFIKTADDVYLSPKEMKLLARLVHAEAEGEPYEGKVAVATVVLNRVEHNQFPDTIKEVIYEKNAFEPVQNGSINEPANKEAHKAVQEALADHKQDQGNENLLYFYNPETATSDWILTRKVVKKIGNHAFAI